MMNRTATRLPRPAVPLLAVAVAVAVTVFLVTSAGAAFGYWLSTNSASPAVAAAATLAVPTGGAPNGTATVAAIPVKWTAPAGYTPASYTVLRCTGSACTGFTAVAAGTCSGLVTAISCTDTDPALAASTTYRYQVKANLANWVSGPSAAFTAATASPTKLVFTVQPTSGQSIQATGTGTFAVSVAIQDASGTTASQDNTDTVTLAIAAGKNPGSGTLTCTGGLTATVTAGVAAFTGCAITKAGVGYQLTASSGTATSLTAPANANSFTIVAGTAAQISATSGGGQSAVNTTTFASPLVATVADINGNPVSGAAVTFQAPTTGTAATFASGCTSNPQAYTCAATTGSNGQATSSAFTASGTIGSYTITAASTGVTGSASYTETNTRVSVVSVTTANGGSTPGKVEAGDTLSITFSGQIDASKICSTWTKGSTAVQQTTGTATISSNTGGNNSLTFSQGLFTGCTLNLGSIDLGSSQYYVPFVAGTSMTLAGSTVSYDGTAHVLKLTLGTLGVNLGTMNTVASSVLTLTLASTITDVSGNALASTTFTSAAGRQF